MRAKRGLGVGLGVVAALGGCRQIIGYEDAILIDGGVTAGCSNGAQDGSETDVDCGGSSCAPCGPGKGCADGSDCASALCNNGTCLAAACDDKIKNGDETDVDCGGKTCAACSAGAKCAGDADCVSGTCTGGACASTCSDMIKGGAETDVDCGGGAVSGCTPCADSKHCKLGGDCQSAVCQATVCQANYVAGEHFGGMGAATPLGFAVDSTGKAVLAGDFSGSINLGSGPLNSAGNTNSDAFVAAFGPSGAALWSKPFGDAQGAQSNSVAVGPTGQIVVAGMFQGKANFGGGAFTSAGSFDAFVSAFSATGAPLWSKQLGDSMYQIATSVAVDKDGNVIVMGSFDGTVLFGGSSFTSAGGEMFVAKYDVAGGPVWLKQFSGPRGRGAAVDKAGNIVIAGDFGGTISLGGPMLTSAGGSDIFVAELDASGGHIWSARFGDAEQQLFPRVAVDGDGDVVIAGNFTGTIDFGGDSFTSAMINHLFMAKFDGAGHHLWSKQFGGDQTPVNLNGLAASGSGGVALAGNFTGMLDLGGSPLVAASAGGDSFLATFDGSGAFLWNRRLGDVKAAFPNITGIAFTGSQHLLMTGTFAGTLDFGGGPATSTGASDVFLVEYLTP
jgi:uncharacterized protein (AIM24 family)